MKGSRSNHSGALPGARAIPPLARDTARLRLRPLSEDDGDAFVRVVRRSDESWRPWTPAREPGIDERELFRRELARTRHGAAVGSHLRLGAFERDGSLVGLFAVNEIVRGVFQSGYASWQVAADRTGEGYGTEAVRALLDAAFSPAPHGLGLHRVQANIMPTNAASLAIARKVGFRHEGLAERYLAIAGRWEDHEMFAITVEEWRDRDG